ncbi:hypothetical protein ACWEK5_19300 [Rhodococcus koreensis]|uniref:hypothetical protein n=1 Tax=Rhodococcus sp. T2V TaxID=3034164 RepID=UPI0023E209F4|nr:hypothetical protein [Rhodococcus sp. T2V]MDF3309476.1 hypothetical protein [Rhodococcus sp. T2V]
MTNEKGVNMDDQASSVEKRAKALLSEFVLDNDAEGAHRRKVDLSWSSSGRSMP